MGTDIHCWLEVKREGRWHSFFAPEPGKYEPGEMCVPYCYHDRHYAVFAVLANVRNGYGFAGVPTGDPVSVIAEPRGLPDDMSPEVAKACEWVEHTPSWLCIQELIDFDWSQTTMRQGVLSAAEFSYWDEWGRPDGEQPRAWCGDVQGPGIEHLSEAEMRVRIKSLREQFPQAWQKEAERLKVSCRWPVQYSEMAGRFYSHYLPKWTRILKEHEDARIVFFFDS